jgi:hypothetical protein
MIEATLETAAPTTLDRRRSRVPLTFGVSPSHLPHHPVTLRHRLFAQS